MNTLRSVAAILAALVALSWLTAFGFPDVATWSRQERATLSSMTLAKRPAPPRDPSNAVADKPEAAELGKRLFADVRLSGNGAVSCASCHAPDRQFQDGLAVGKGMGVGKRRTMPVAATAHSPWFFWDGRKDSPWSQALGPLEDGVEHGGNRMRFASVLRIHYQQDYEAIFGPLPDLRGLPDDASPLGSPDERQAWRSLSDEQRDAVNRAFANLGKAIAAYERTVNYGESRFDRYAQAVLAGDRAGQAALTAPEVNGLRLFIGKAQCATCHNGPLFTDQAFHNTGVPPRNPLLPDHGRAAAMAIAKSDEFNCLGRYSDAPPRACTELSFMAADDPRMEGAFKTPSLRNVALRPPYMHAGQIATLDEVVAHYAERRPIQLSDQEARDLVAFLGSLSGPVVEIPAR